jgi:hypothetical protein
MATSSFISRTPKPLLGASALGIAALVGVAVVLGATVMEHRAAKEAALIHLAEKIMTMEMQVGQRPSSPSQPADVYRPFRRFIVPGSQAAKWTQWVMAQDIAAFKGPSPIRPVASHWWVRRPAVIVHEARETTVQLSIYWWKTFAPRGESTGTATVSVGLQKTAKGWRVNGIGWDSNPGAGPDQPDSFAYDLQNLAGVTSPPQGDPPALKPQVNNP